MSTWLKGGWPNVYICLQGGRRSNSKYPKIWSHDLWMPKKILRNQLFMIF